MATKKPKSAASPKKPAAVTPINSARPGMQTMHRPVLTEEEMIARAALRLGANLKGARCVDGSFVVGKRVNGGLQDVQTIVLQNVQTPEGATNVRVQFVPFVPPFFIKDADRPEVGDRHIMETYDLPDEIADFYLEKTAMFAAAAAARSAEQPAEG